MVTQLTLHEQKDVEPFMIFAKTLQEKQFTCNKSLRLNVFAGIELNLDDPVLVDWKIKTGIEWIVNCPLPPNETFMRL